METNPILLKMQADQVLLRNRLRSRCALCQKVHNTILIPGQCLARHGEAGHRLCQSCWFGQFATEGRPHGCPGCLVDDARTLRRFRQQHPDAATQVPRTGAVADDAIDLLDSDDE